MKTFITFGQAHTHHVNGRTFDCNCVAVIHHTEPEEGREIAFEVFGRKFCFEYPESIFDFDSMKFFPRGLINLNHPLPVEPDDELDDGEFVSFIDEDKGEPLWPDKTEDHVGEISRDDGDYSNGDSDE